ncbi:MAG: hypothetical protein WBF84_15695 [Castellaniella sp.]|uniref:Transposase n=1 Tax=Castellaniella hirudinis TaxID=1144617 RepID=A0ABV8S2Q5_9BURK
MRQGAGAGESGHLFWRPLKNIGTHINLAVIAQYRKKVENCDAIFPAESLLNAA